MQTVVEIHCTENRALHDQWLILAQFIADVYVQMG